MSHDFKWKEQYSVHVKQIDNQHKKLVELIYRLFTSIGQQKTREELGKILDELIEYAGYHFSTEEKYFEEFNYEHTKEHIEEHRKFAKKVTELQKGFHESEVEVSFELIDFLEDWLLDHLITSDQKYVECFTSNGLK